MALNPEAIRGAGSVSRNPGRVLVHFDGSVSDALRETLLRAPQLFAEAGPEAADLILLENDEVDYVRANPLVRRFRAKCLCISETDIPTYALPGLYAANLDGFLSRNRTETISYFISERIRGNAAVRDLIGKPLEKRYTYSFLGGSNSWARKRLFRLVKSGDDVVVEPTHAYYHWSAEGQDAEVKARQQQRYAEILAQSKFALCPRGCGLSSYRLFEAMSLGVAPVIIADGWRPISGVDWRFALFVPEAKIPQLDAIVRAHASEWRERGDAARQAYEALLAPDQVAAMVHERLLRVRALYDRRREARLAPAVVARVRFREAYWRAFFSVKTIALRVLKVTRLPSPVLLRFSPEQQLASQKAPNR